MTPQERRLSNAVQRRAGEVSPELAAAILRAYARIRESMTEAQLARAMALGRLFDEILTQAVLEIAFQPVRQRLRESIVKGVPFYAKTLPPSIAGDVSLAFDILSPHVIMAIRQLETRVLAQFTTDVRETVRQAVEAGLRDGQSARTVAKGLRDVIGLAPNHLHEVEHFRTKLQHAHERGDAFDNKLRDKRFDSTLRTARKTGEPLSAERVEKMTEAYRKRRIAQNAATNARQAAVDAQKLANRLAWEDAVAMGAVSRDQLMKQRIGVDDERERPEHRAINDQVRHFDEPYSNGEMVSGDHSWGCRCIDKYFATAA